MKEINLPQQQSKSVPINISYVILRPRHSPPSLLPLLLQNCRNRNLGQGITSRNCLSSALEARIERIIIAIYFSVKYFIQHCRT